MSEMVGKAAIAGGAYAATREAGVQLSELVRSMVAMTDGDPAVAPGLMVNGVTEQVVCDVDVDGDRYLLVKILPSARSGASLSPREREIVRMVALGHPNKVIAAVLNISSWTVCTHLRRIFAKLGVTSRAAMVAKAAESGGIIEAVAPGESMVLRQRGPAQAAASVPGPAHAQPQGRLMSRAGSRVSSPNGAPIGSPSGASRTNGSTTRP